MHAEPPIFLQLVSVHTDVLIFKWNKTVQCSLQYKTNATGCGNCSNHTMSNSVTCRGVPLNSTEKRLCMYLFAVKAIVCGSNKISLDSANVILKGIVICMVHWKL